MALRPFYSLRDIFQRPGALTIATVYDSPSQQETEKRHAPHTSARIGGPTAPAAPPGKGLQGCPVSGRPWRECPDMPCFGAESGADCIHAMPGRYPCGCTVACLWTVRPVSGWCLPLFRVGANTRKRNRELHHCTHLPLSPLLQSHFPITREAANNHNRCSSGSSYSSR